MIEKLSWEKTTWIRAIDKINEIIDHLLQEKSKENNMNLEIGKIYEFRKDIDRRDFSFGYKKGVFIGYTKGDMPRFILNVERGTECFINATDDNFIEFKHEPTKEVPDIRPEQLHLWYLEATEHLDPQYVNSKAQIPYEELKPSQKAIDKYIANKINQEISALYRKDV